MTIHITRLSRKEMLGILAGGGVLLGSMLLLAFMAVIFGWIQQDKTGFVDLGPWLALEVLGGAVATVVAGWVCRNISLRFRGPAILALVVCSLGLVEAAEILRYMKGNSLTAPVWLVLCAPFVAASGILLGGSRRTPRDEVTVVPLEFKSLSTVWRYAIPMTVLLAATLLALFVLPKHETDSGSSVLATAITLDLTMTVPGLVYFFLIRTRRLPWIAVIPTVAAGYLIATLAIPKQHHGLLEHMRWLVMPVELAVVTYLLIQVRRIFSATPQGEGDFVTRLRTAAVDMLGNRVVAGILATEIGILYHAFKGKRDAKDPSYTVHRRSGYGSVLVGLFIVILVEAIALHFLVSLWSNTFAWVLTGLTGYAVIWFVGDYRALRGRPILLTPTALHVRVGLRWEISVALDSILEVRAHLTQKEKSRDTLTAVVLGKPNLCLSVRHPVDVIGMYGIRKRANEIWLQVDEPDRLQHEVRAVLTRQ